MKKYNRNKLEQEIHNCIKILKNGGIILYPTDTIWGIGCDTTNQKAVNQIFQIKKREKNKPLISLVSDKIMLARYTDDFNLINYNTTDPTTYIFNNVSGLSNGIITKNKTAAFRIPNDMFCQKIISILKKPIASTSANISGEKIATKFSEISNQIKENVDYIVNLRHNEKMTKASNIIMINKDNTTKKIR